MVDKKRIALFGGSGGLGSKLLPMLLDEYDVISPTSKEVDIRFWNSVEAFFLKNEVDIVINLSGCNSDGFLHKLHNTYDTNRMLTLNMEANVNLLTHCLPPMRDRGYGRVILTSSVLSEKVQVGTGIYSATKAFVDSLVRTASAENISKGVTCNSLRLGYFDGGMCHRIPEKYQEVIKNSIGLKRWGTIEELYNVVDFLIKTEYITGQNLNVSGGLI